MTLGVVLLFFAFLLFKENDFINKIFPVNKSFDKDILVYFLGSIIPLILLTFGKLFGKTIFNPKLIAPLAQFGTSVGVETFSAIKTVASPFVYGFITIEGASVIEELVLGVTFLITGVFATYLFIKIYEVISKEKINIKTRSNVLFVGGMILSILFFTLLHSFNQTYINNPQLFLFAALFRFFLNLIIYKFLQLGIIFAIGFHRIWNSIAIGQEAYMNYLLSPGGLIIHLIIALLLFVLIVRYKEVFKEFVQIITFRSKIGY